MRKTKIHCVIIMFLLATNIYAATQYQYDSLHRLTKITYDCGMYITYSYDEVGNRTRRVSTLIADIAIDGTVNLEDYSMLASQWMDDNCDLTDNCQGADLNHDNVIDVRDLAYLGQFWLETVQP
jgi:hypothetical protein